MRVLLISIILVVLFSVLPFHQPAIEDTVSCRNVESYACLAILDECKSLGDNDFGGIVDPIAQFDLQGAADIAVKKCLKQKYEPNCIVCDSSLTWYQKVHVYGPWYLQYFPAAQDMWQYYFPTDYAEENQF